MPHNPILCHRCGLRIPDEGEYIPPGDPGALARSDDADGVSFDFGSFDLGGASEGGSAGGSSFRDLLSQFFRGGRTDRLGTHREETQRDDALSCHCPDRPWSLFSSQPQPENLDWHDKHDR